MISRIVRWLVNFLLVKQAGSEVPFDWDDKDAEELHRYLSHPAGRKLLAVLLAQAHSFSISALRDGEHIHFKAGIARGYREMLTFMVTLSTIPEKLPEVLPFVPQVQPVEPPINDLGTYKR
jgi:hypothetical protein